MAVDRDLYDASAAPSGRVIWLTRAFAVIVAAIAAFLIIGGARLVTLGGSAYYVLAGLAYGAAAFDLWRLRAWGGWLIASMFAVTVAWAVAEVGVAFWPLFPRLMMPLVLGAVALIFVAALRPPRGRRLPVVLSAFSFAVAAILLGLTFVQHGVIRDGAQAPFTVAGGDNHPADWAAYGRDTKGLRYSPFDQINRNNVGRLQLAWSFRSGDSGPGTDENTPLQLGDLVVTCSRNGHLAALDADTGQVRWRFWSGDRSPLWQRCRSVSYFDTGEQETVICAKRVIQTTNAARLFALDLRTGRPCPGFGVDGGVDLKQGMGPSEPGMFYQTSAPLIARDRIIVGGWVRDNLEKHEPSGVVRAFDARTGDLIWAWDLGDPSITKLPPSGKTYTRGTPNMWTTAAYDDKLGLVYAPLGNETPDYLGMGRNPKSNEYNSALVALDVMTGRERWHFQTTHHDIWDYDLPSQPALVDLPSGQGTEIPAVMQTTKRGQIFLLNRATGAPLAQVVERPVPQRGHSPGEVLSPTQPYSTGMPTIGDERLSESKMWGMTMLDQLACRIDFRTHRYEGDFTPVGTDWALQQPSNGGGMNWGSISFDPRNKYAYVVDMRLPNQFKLFSRADYPKAAKVYGDPSGGHGNGPMNGSPYGVITLPWLTVFGVPCNQPPFGTITAVNLNTRRIAWQVPAGTVQDTGPFGIPTGLQMPLGMPAYAGTSLTAAGLLFFAGFQDDYIRAYDAATGDVLWRRRLPVGASATPMTYVSPRTGRQYVLISAGGSGDSKKVGDYVMAFTLK